MDPATLVNTQQLLETGDRAAKLIAEDPLLKPRAIYWWYDYGNEEFRFTVATQLYDESGPRAVYVRIRKLLAQHDLLSQLPLDQVWAIPQDHWTAKAVRSALKNRSLPFTISETMSEGVHIAFAHVFFVR